jgi:hypothetical protein
MLPDIFNDDAFSLVSLTATINGVDHVPGRAGELAFAGVGEGVNTIQVAIESKNEILTLIPTSPRGGPAPKEDKDKANLRSVLIPQVKLEDTIQASEIQGVREFGSTDALAGAIAKINASLAKQARRHDLTLENLRMGALAGLIKDSDGSTLYDTFSLFGVAQEAEVDFELDDPTTDVRSKCAAVVRLMKRNAKTVIPATANVWALASDDFFDALIKHASVKGVWDGWASAERRLGASYVFGVFEFGGIFFENYQGTDDNTTVTVPAGKARFFWTGVPGLYAEYFAPADFMETVNTIGLPRYAKVAPDQRFNRYVELHTQQNPLPLCLRPKTLIVAKKF